jgi:hypothetical protein
MDPMREGLRKWATRQRTPEEVAAREEAALRRASKTTTAALESLGRTTLRVVGFYDQALEDEAVAIGDAELTALVREHTSGPPAWPSDDLLMHFERLRPGAQERLHARVHELQQAEFKADKRAMLKLWLTPWRSEPDLSHRSTRRVGPAGQRLG